VGNAEGAQPPRDGPDRRTRSAPLPPAPAPSPGPGGSQQFSVVKRGRVTFCGSKIIVDQTGGGTGGPRLRRCLVLGVLQRQLLPVLLSLPLEDRRLLQERCQAIPTDARCYISA
jgi:hypothetical protein